MRCWVIHVYRVKTDREYYLCLFVWLLFPTHVVQRRSRECPHSDLTLTTGSRSCLFLSLRSSLQQMNKDKAQNKTCCWSLWSVTIALTVWSTLIYIAYSTWARQDFRSNSQCAAMHATPLYHRGLLKFSVVHGCITLTLYSICCLLSPNKCCTLFDFSVWFTKMFLHLIVLKCFWHQYKRLN